MIVWQHTILGQPYSKANRRQPVTDEKTGKMRFIKSKRALQYVEDFEKQAAFYRIPERELLVCPLRVTIGIAYRTMMPDLDESLILDLLEGVAYVNDRQVIEKHIYRLATDSRNPRAEILIETVEEQ